jgi:conjugative relaxase-like TrwC/TraI family protein
MYEALLAAEPHATAERRRDLRLQATSKARQSPLFFDLTISLSKSISVFHASLGENARLARQVGDTDGNQYWTALVTETDEMIWQAVRAGFAYFQREAGYTRTGSHNTRLNGRETGQWHEADLVVAHWMQHTSRDGDMQLHVHSQIAHTAKTGTDGKWRAPDSLGYNEHIGAVAALVSQHLEEALTARFGLEWTARDDGHGFEIKGISGEMMRVFSSRRESITADLRMRAARFEQRYGRAPSQRELAHLAQASNFATRAAKAGTLDVEQAHAGWAGKLTRTLGVSLALVAPSVWHGRADAHAGEPDSPAPVPAELEVARAAQKAVALAQQDKSTWTRADVIKYLGRVVPRTGRDPAAAAALLEDLGRPGAGLGVRAGPVPGCPRASAGAAQPAPRGRAQRVPTARRRPLRHPRAAGHGTADAHPRRRGGRAAPIARAGRTRARRRPRAARRRTHRPRATRAWPAHADGAAGGPGRGRAGGPD